MAFLESLRFCTAEEYRREIEHRVNETDIQDNEIYALAVLLKSKTREAAKLPVRIAAPLDGLIEVTFLDDDLQPVSCYDAPMRDGIVSLRKVRIYEEDNRTSYLAKEAFLKDYFEDQFGGLLAESQSLSLGAR